MSPSESIDNRDDVVWSEAGGVKNLLGFDLGADGVDRSGLNALINTALVAHRRLPMLDVVFDRTARRMSTTLRQLTNGDAEASLDNVTSVRFGDFLQGQSAFGVIGVIRSKALDGAMAIAADPAFIHGAVDLLLGGRRGAGRQEERVLTAIELSIAHRVLQALVRDFDEAFRVVADPLLSLERIETTPRFAAIAQDTSVCAIAKFKVTIDDRASRLQILSPYATLESLQEKLRCDFVAEAGEADASWRAKLAAGIASADLEVQAVIADRTMRLGALQALGVGDVLSLGPAHDPHIELRVGAAAIAAGRIGKLGDLIAVRLETPVDQRAAVEAAEAAA